MYKYGLVGNCQTAALISNMGSVDWLCMPRPDSPPVFGRILDKDGGYFSIESVSKSTSRQTYIPNTNVLVTDIQDKDGNAFRITDFCPRFEQHGRMYRPISFFRKIEPIHGSPTIKVICRPVSGWEKEPVKVVRGNSHLRYEVRGESLRLVTNMSLTHLCDEVPVLLKETVYFGLTWSIGIQDDLVRVSEDFLQNTIEYWKTWVKHCTIPTFYQKETIRSALTLKLHCYEDTGAILAALTTSLPEENGQTRNWDYRYCWLRDAYYVLSSLHNLGHFEEMEGFLTFLLNIAERHEHSRERLRPVYRLDQSLPLPEQEHLNWEGFRGSRPVRSNNQAAEHVQNDVYGEMILTLAPIFFDQRFHHLRTKEHEGLLSHLVKLCIRNISNPDAGLWEIRNGWQEHSFSNLMCWAGIERMSRIQEMGFLKDLNIDLARARDVAENAIRLAVQDGSLRNGPKDSTLDAALLQLPILRFPDQDVCRNTVNKIYQELRMNDTDIGRGFLYRYLRPDDFGNPKSAFLICSFWLVQALAKTGQIEEASRVMKSTVIASNEVGLLSEHFDPLTGEQAGNFPQAYSHVGLINAAFAVSPAWSEVL